MLWSNFGDTVHDPLTLKVEFGERPDGPWTEAAVLDMKALQGTKKLSAIPLPASIDARYVRLLPGGITYQVICMPALVYRLSRLGMFGPISWLALSCQHAFKRRLVHSCISMIVSAWRFAHEPVRCRLFRASWGCATRKTASLLMKARRIGS